MNKTMKLTKTDYLRYLEAPLHLWAEKNGQIDRTLSDFDLHLMDQGYEVENLAREYVEKHILNAHKNQSVICQKTFTDRQFTARTDILLYKPASGAYDLYEVKSGTSTKPEHIYDAAYQYLIVKTQINIARVFILHLNKNYVRFSHLNLEELFVADEITEKVLERKHEVALMRAAALEAASALSSEQIQHCFSPRDCPCPGLCHPGLPEASIYDIPRLSRKKKSQLLAQGILDIADIPVDFPLSARQRLIVNTAQSHEEVIDRTAIRKEFQSFVFPLYFLDYETFMAAVPLHDGYKPQQHMVFQYSLHKMEGLNGDIQHTEHLALTQDDPSRSLVRQLREDIGDSGTVFVWSKSFETTRNKEMAAIHTEYAGFLTRLNERIVDLADFIRQGHYQHPDFKGRWSIKCVLPVMLPELSYEEMEIGKGDQAMMAWWKLTNDALSADEAEKMKKALLAYCKMDTWAMVEIWKKLQKYC